MKKFIISALLFHSAGLFACPNFYGKWQSSAKLTMEFTKQWSNIEPRAMAFLEQTTGTSITEVTKKYIAISDTNKTLTINGKQLEWPATNEKTTYKLLGCTEDSVVIEYHLFNQHFINQLHFPNKNTYWVYTGSALLTNNAHTREYFVRIK